MEQDTPTSEHPVIDPAAPAADAARTLTTVEEVLRDGFAWMRFPTALERRYVDDRFELRRREARIGGLVGLALYDLLLIADFFATPDVFNLAIWLKLGVVTPLSLILLLLLDRLPRPRFLDAALCLLPMLAAAALMHPLRASHSPHSMLGHSALALVPVLTNVLLRPRFWYAFTVSIAVCLLYGLGLGFDAAVPPQALAVSGAILLLCSAGTLIGAHSRECDERRDYLRALGRHLRAVATTETTGADDLDGIHDRHSFDLHLEQRWFDCRSHDLPMSLLLIEADGGADSAQLRQLAAAVKSSVRHAGDLAAHLGGARFAITLPALAESKALTAAEQIRAAIERLEIPLRHGRAGGIATVSIGVAVSASGHPGSPHSLIDAADEALRHAKAAGGNRIETGRPAPMVEPIRAAG